MTSLLTVSDISKKHGQDFLLNNISFTQQHLQKIAIAGETGCGKTTLIKIVAGLGQADSGTVLFEGKQVKGVDEKLMPGHNGIAYLSQHFELSNNYRVEEVLAYANDLTDAESLALYDVCRIDHLLKRKTNTLSGGEKQRVALARLLTRSPRLLLLDEPFSNMDLIHTNILKSVVDEIGDRLGVTCMLISHEPEDMLPWADEIFVMKQGEIIQWGSPYNIYRHPDTEYTAGLFGKYTIPCPSLIASLPGYSEINKFIRPEDFILTVDENEGLKGTVINVAYYGSHCISDILLAGQSIAIKTAVDAIKTGDIVYVRIKE